MANEWSYTKPSSIKHPPQQTNEIPLIEQTKELHDLKISDQLELSCPLELEKDWFKSSLNLIQGGLSIRISNSHSLRNSLFRNFRENFCFNYSWLRSQSEARSTLTWNCERFLWLLAEVSHLTHFWEMAMNTVYFTSNDQRRAAMGTQLFCKKSWIDNSLYFILSDLCRVNTNVYGGHMTLMCIYIYVYRSIFFRLL